MGRRTAAVTALSMALAVCLLYLLYRTDNKYTHPSPQAEYGILLLEEGGPPLTYLIHGWEFYQYQLLTPEDFAGYPPAPTAHVFIGEYMGFEMDDFTASPFGSATYRMNIFTGQEEPGSYTLELPEIFSAYRLWINGELLAQNGNPSPTAYRPEISHDSITFPATDRIDIILAVTNFEHYYSGLIYPPAFGELRAVKTVVDTPVVIAAVRCFFAIAVGLFYLFIGRFTRDRATALSFGVLCFLYAGSASHQLIHFMSSQHFRLWYSLEDFCFYALLAGFVTLCLQRFRPDSKALSLVPLVGVGVGALVALSPYLVPQDSALPLIALSVLIRAYKLAMVCLLLYYQGKAASQGARYGSALLAAVSVFSVSLAVDAGVRLYEPIRYGWPVEIGGFVMVCVLGAVITMDAVEGLREGARLAAQNEQLEMSYELLAQKIEQTKRSSHDLRHHMAVLNKYAQSGDLAGVTDYLSDYTKSLPAGEELHFSSNPAIDAVARYYHAIAVAEGVDIRIRISLPETSLPEQDLCVLCGNLLENAIEACRHLPPEERYIRFGVTFQESFLTIVSDNSFDGAYEKKDGAFSSRKRPGKGIGTASIRAIGEKYQGYAEFSASASQFQASVVLQLP